MEVTYIDGGPDSFWNVTNGLLVLGLMTGRMQFGDNTYAQFAPATVNVAGDLEDPDGPSYARMFSVVDEPAVNVGTTISQRLSRDGTFIDDPELGARGVAAAYFVSETGHTVAGPFWDFIGSTGPIFEDGEYSTAELLSNPFFATGYPVTEAYWSDVRVNGELKVVLIQCFKRRCLTYTPDNEPGWQVGAGNVGRQYHAWRYASSPQSQRPACQPGEGPTFAGEDLVQQVFIG